MIFSGDFVVFLSVDLVVKVLIKPIPAMPVTMAMPMVLSPKMLPSTISNAAIKQRETPKANSARCQVLVFLFNFYTSLFISNFILDISNFMLDKYNIMLFKCCCTKTKREKLT
jgi:hypothetical protein